MRGTWPSDSIDDIVLRWRLWRGVDTWPEVTAKVFEVKSIDSGEGEPTNKVRFTFTPLHDTDEQYKAAYVGTTRITKSSILWNTAPGDSITIRYNPRKPTQTLCEDATEAGMELMAWFLFACILLFALIAKLIQWIWK